MTVKKTIVIGSRGSRLARTQAGTVTGLLSKAFPESEFPLRIISTEGDIDRSSPLSSFGGRGAFVRSIENALLKHEIDLAVHSLKDLPSQLPDGLTLGAAPLREDPRDVLISATGTGIETLPPGSIVATGSDRRREQISRIRPDLVFSDIRGNIETRIAKLDKGNYDAIVLAAAGLHRLGLDAHITQYFDTKAVVPAPCQGAIGIECRDGDNEILAVLSAIENRDVRCCVDMERAFIATLGMGCHTPVGAFAERDGDTLEFTCFVLNETAGTVLRRTLKPSCDQAVTVAHETAEQIREILNTVNGADQAPVPNQPE